MNTREMTKELAAKHGMTDKQVRELLDGLLDAIVAAVAKGEEVALHGFGKFKRKEAPARQGRNPATGEAIQIAASSKVTFTPAKALKNRL